LSQAASEVVGKLIAAAIYSLSPQTAPAQSVANRQAPVRTEIPRLNVLMGETRDVPLPGSMTSVLVVSPEIASVVLSARGLTLTGLQVGETILLAFDGTRRSTYLVQVIGRTYANTHKGNAAIDPSIALSPFSGSYSLSYSAPFGGAPTLFRQSFDFHQKLSQGRTLRFSSDAFKFMGQGDRNRLRATAFGLGFNRLSLGIDSASGSLDILDSQVNVSPLSFNGFTMRGLHVVSAANSPLRGVEFFAGFARPSQSLFEMNQGRLLGIVAPLAHGEFWRVRAGIFYAAPGQNNRLGNGGTVWQLDGNYAPSKNFVSEGEVAYGNGGLSWRARLDLQSKHVIGFGEILRLDRRSPLVSIGAQAGGRETQAFGVQWLATNRLNASLNYNHTATVPPANAGRATFDRTTLFANASYRLNQQQRLGFRFSDQLIEIELPASSSRLQLETRTATITHDTRFNQSWSNNLSVSLTASREARAAARTDSGLAINNQLRYAFKGGSATGFVNYTNQSQSLAGLIVRNPALLPPLLQPVFAADPVLFLQQNRSVLSLLLPGVELPQTRGLDAGVRFQKAFARVNLASEVRYSAAEILGRNQRNLITSVSMDLRLDAANSLQVSGSRSLGFNSPGSQSSLTISYIHRFGAGSGGGLQFSRLLGLERGVIEGRVFFDLNGNGRDDASEPGVAGVKVEIDADRSTTTDDSGRFHFQINSGAYHIAVVSADLGVTWRASSATELKGFLAARQTVNVSFGVTNYGSIAGRIFNDVAQEGGKTAGILPGVGGVRLSLRPLKSTAATQTVIGDASGAYEFRNLAPGSYTLAIDPATLPADFQVLKQTSWAITIEPLRNFYLDIPLLAQRAVSGVVFIDVNSDGKFDATQDEPIEGARVIAGKTEVITGKGGSYILRNMRAGKIEVRARAPWGGESIVVIVELGEEPTRRKGINLATGRKQP
jgi:hypothetical protein